MRFAYAVSPDIYDINGKHYRVVWYFDEEVFERSELTECHESGLLYDDYDDSFDERDQPQYTRSEAKRAAERYMERMIKEKFRRRRSSDSDPETDYGSITLAKYHRRRRKATTTKRTATKRSYKRSTTKRKAPTRRRYKR